MEKPLLFYSRGFLFFKTFKFLAEYLKNNYKKRGHVVFLDLFLICSFYFIFKLTERPFHKKVNQMIII